MIALVAVREDGSRTRYPILLIDRARHERQRGESMSERGADTLDVLELAHVAAVRLGETRPLDEWAADITDVESEDTRPTSPAGAPPAG